MTLGPHICGRHRAWAGVLGIGIVGAGCLPSRRSDYQQTRPLPAPVSSTQADQLWEAVHGVLRQHRFRLDRVDRRAGVITTLPATSQHFFEFWRHDVNTREDFWEATINPMRRWVEVTFHGADEETWNAISVTVHKERLSVPDRPMTSPGGAYVYSGGMLRSVGGVSRVTPPEQERWVSRGDDRAMGEYLLDAIMAKAGIPRGSDVGGGDSEG